MDEYDRLLIKVLVVIVLLLMVIVMLGNHITELEHELEQQTGYHECSIDG